MAEAVSLGHPLVVPGLDIIITLLNYWNRTMPKFGAAAYRNGGGELCLSIEKIK